VERLRALLKQQDRDLTELLSEVERKEITRERTIRLMKIVQRNLEISERIVAILERTHGVARETTEERIQGFRTKLN
jgi:hypothetical protein